MTSGMTRQVRAYAFALAAVGFWSTVATAFKLSLRYLTPVQLLLWASLVSALILLGMLGFRGRLGELRRSSPREIARSAALGLLNPFLYYIILFEAYDILPAQEALSLNYTWALAVALLSAPLLGQKIGMRNIIALLISFAGVVIIATRGDVTSLEFEKPFGVALAVGSSLIWALYWLFNLRDGRPELVKLFLNFAFGFVFVLIIALFTNELNMPPIEGFAGAAYVGIFEMGITFVLWLRAMSLSETTAQVSNLIYLSPFLSLLIINIVLGESLLVSTFAGLVLIITGIIIQQFGGIKRHKNN
jgi:drug/metabolite transporter (DMT)-like permease